MNTIINRFWQLQEAHQLGVTEIALFFYLLRRSGGSTNPFRCNNTRVFADIEVSYKTLCSARNRLKQVGLIDFTTKNGSALCTYSISSTFGKITQVREEVREEVTAEVREEVRVEVGADNVVNALEINDLSVNKDNPSHVRACDNNNSNINNNINTKDIDINTNNRVNNNSNIDKEFKEKREKCEKEKREKQFDFRTSLLALGVSRELVNDFMLVRNRTKAVNSATAFRLIAAELTKAEADGITADECISLAIEKSWRGFRYEWLKNDRERNNRLTTTTYDKRVTTDFTDGYGHATPYYESTI